MDRFEFIIISLAGWYFHPGNKRSQEDFMAEVVDLGSRINDALEEANSWPQSPPQASPP